MSLPSFILDVTGKLKNDYIRLNAYFASLRTMINSHVDGTADIHPASNITNDSVNVTGIKVSNALDKLDLDADNHLASSTAHNSQDIVYSGSVAGATEVKEGLDLLDERIDNLIVGAGTSPAEVTDARSSGVKNKVFTVLDDRLESIENQLGYHSIDIGMVGDDSNNDAIQLNTWITEIGVTKVTLYLSIGTYKIATNVIIPENIIIKPLYGSILKIYNTYTITGTNTKIATGLYQIFDLSLGGTLAGTWNVIDVYPEWFGVQYDGTTETIILQKAFNFAVLAHANLTILEKNTVVTNNITLNTKDNFGINCKGIMKRPDSSAGSAIIELISCTNVKIPFLNMDGNALNNGGDEDNPLQASVLEFLHCLRLDTCDNIEIGTFYALNPTGDGLTIVNTNNVRINILHTKSTKCVGRNSLSIITGINIFVDTLICDNTGHMTMPGGFDIEPSLNTDIVNNVHIGTAYIKSAGTNPFAIMATNNSTVTDIFVDSVNIIKVKKQNTINKCCIISASNVYINSLQADGAGYDQLLYIGGSSTDKVCDNVNIKLAKGTNVGYSYIGFEKQVTNLNAKIIIVNSVSGGITITECKDIKLDLDIMSVLAGSYCINKSGNKAAENVTITGNISKRGTGAIAMITSVASSYIINWLLDGLDFTSWAQNTRIIGAGFTDNVKKINCANINYLSAKPNFDIWSVGDIIYNTVPVAGGNIGWVCTVGGAGGTWVKFGVTDLSGSTTWDPADLVTGTGETSASITVTGAALGDQVVCSAPYDLQGCIAHPYVDATDSVKIRVQNGTGGNINLASGTWRVKVIKP